MVDRNRKNPVTFCKKWEKVDLILVSRLMVMSASSAMRVSKKALTTG